ncbi:Rv1733c family protein [Streptomyces sp. NPDC054765]
MRAMSGVWRRRHNPLWRRTDRIEAWVAFAAVLLIGLGATSAGWLAGRAAHGALLETVRLQHQQRHLEWVTVDRLLSRAPLDPDPETSSQRDAHRRVVGRWTARDGSAHLAPLDAPRPVEAGERFRIWTDGQGREMPRPMDVSTADTHAVLAGLGTATGVGMMIEGARRMVVWQLMVRRFRRWDAEWERAGQDWGRAGAGS